MQKNKKTRNTRSQQPSSDHERKTYLILVILVLGFILAGVFQYFAILVIGSAVVVGYFGWRWWTQRHTVTTAPKKKAPPRRKPKPKPKPKQRTR